MSRRAHIHSERIAAGRCIGCGVSRATVKENGQPRWCQECDDARAEDAYEAEKEYRREHPEEYGDA